MAIPLGRELAVIIHSLNEHKSKREKKSDK